MQNVCKIAEKRFQLISYPFWLVCNAGFYEKSSDCVACPVNGVKNSPGNDTECDIDIMCDGESNVLNAESTACGKIVII